MGYGGSKREAAQVVGKSGDGGIDGLKKINWDWMPFIFKQKGGIARLAVLKYKSLREHYWDKREFL
jgi:hypothetical protein